MKNTSHDTTSVTATPAPSPTPATSKPQKTLQPQIDLSVEQWMEEQDAKMEECARHPELLYPGRRIRRSF